MTTTTPSAGQEPVTLVFQPVGRKITLPAGVNLLTAAQQAGVEIVAACSGVGICGTCRVQVIQGRVSDPTPTELNHLSGEELNAGYRLACQTEALSDLRLHLPPSSLARGQQLQVEGKDAGTAFSPAVRVLDLQLPKPSLADLRSDLTRINDAAAEAGCAKLDPTPALIAGLSTYLREHDWTARLALRPGRETSGLVGWCSPQDRVLGLALDIGSTKIAAYLVDLETGATLGSLGVMNPQISYGEDVVSRIAYANRGEHNRRQLQSVLVDAVQAAAETLCRQASADVRQIMDVVAVGNTAIHHFFCGLPVEPLGASPYLPVVQSALSFPAAELGLHFSPGAWVYLPPNIAGYVGADHTAALLATRTYREQESTLLLDIGTNTEISLIHRGTIYSCSTASGPAFEGAHINDGVRAVPGAVERVLVNPDGELVVQTIGAEAPIGICGSGILSAIAALHQTGRIDRRGVLTGSGEKRFVLVPASQSGHGRDIAITRRDVHEIQLAKAAIRTGINILLRYAGIQPEDVQRWIVAGAFGTHIDLRAAVQIGLFPPLPLERFEQVGNAAGMGARQMLLSAALRQEADAFTREIQYIELTTEPEFQDQYVSSMYFPDNR
ncbi:MAG TPA: DUF4445 domain-containing protein [Chloroflexi bacterium]|nr:DUF4445 domain-containing protein [Chloroflexota bacterium]